MLQKRDIFYWEKCVYSDRYFSFSGVENFFIHHFMRKILERLPGRCSPRQSDGGQKHCCWTWQISDINHRSQSCQKGDLKRIRRQKIKGSHLHFSAFFVIDRNKVEFLSGRNNLEANSGTTRVGGNICRCRKNIARSSRSWNLLQNPFHHSSIS